MKTMLSKKDKQIRFRCSKHKLKHLTSNDVGRVGEIGTILSLSHVVIDFALDQNARTKKQTQ